jgi:hypothetical protein
MHAVYKHSNKWINEWNNASYDILQVIIWNVNIPVSW